MTTLDPGTAKVWRAYNAQQRRQLEAGLRAARSHYDQETIQAQRQGATHAVSILLEHLDDLGISRSLQKPVTDIWVALLEADRGRLHPLVTPKHVKGRPPMPLWRLDLMATSALVMDLMMLAGKSKQIAAARVVRELNRCNVRLGGRSQTNDWKKVAGWRNELSKAAKGSPRYSEDWQWAGKMYVLKREMALLHIRESGKDPEQAALRKLTRFRNIIPTSG